MTADESYKEEAAKPDLEAIEHMYSFRMTLEEMPAYIEQCIVPARFEDYAGDMREYTLTACSAPLRR